MKELKNKLAHYGVNDSEELVDMPVPTLTANEIADVKIDAIKSEAEVNDSIETMSELSSILIDLPDEIEAVKESAQEMTPVELGAVAGSIEDRASKLVDIPSVDTESCDGDVYAATIMNLEGIGSAISGAMGSFFDMFKSNETLLNKAVITAQTSWIKTNESRIAMAADSLKEAKDTKPENVKVGDRLMTVRALELNLSDLEAFAKTVSVIDVDKIGSTKVDKEAYNYALREYKLKGVAKIKPSRIDGDKLSYVSVGTIGDTKQEGFTGYSKKSVDSRTKKQHSDYITDKISLADAKKMLETAKRLNADMGTLSKNILSEINSLKNMLNGDLEKAKWDSGSMLNGKAWFAVGILATVGVLGGMVAYATITGSSIPTRVGRNVAYGGLAGSVVTGIAKKRTFEELAAKDKVKIIRARLELTTRYSKDAIYGLNNLINELIDVAEAIIKAHGSNSAE